MLTETPADNSIIEKAFDSWASAVSLAEKLRTIRMAKVVDGEAFGILTNNPVLSTPVKMDLRLVETDQVATSGTEEKNEVDGILFDQIGNPISYNVLKQHPGSSGATKDSDKMPAASVLHLYRVDRPGQARGIPEITPALSLFAQLRRYTLAVIGAAESAADFAMTLYTDAPPNGDSDEVEPLEQIELERKIVTTLPGGWKLGQTKAEQPTTTYAEFKNQILAEIARCLNVPFNVAAGNSSGYNYASGRLDFQTYFKSIRVEQSVIELVILDRIFAAWLAEATLISGYLPESIRKVDADTDHQWFWDGTEHVDPAKEANAQQTRLQSNTTTLAEEYAKRGRDWEAELRQRAKERAICKELGIPTETPGAPAGPAPADESEEDAQPSNKSGKE
jgi:lambda family phage portal protein